jgi:hypothetical protein
MSEPNLNREAEHVLDHGDAELVREIAQSYRPAPAAPSARAAFRAGVDARIRRRASRRIWTAGTALATAAVAMFALRGVLPSDSPLLAPTQGAEPDMTIASAATPDDTVEEALLTVGLPASSEEQALPADYQAIDDLFLEGV